MFSAMKTMRFGRTFSKTLNATGCRYFSDAKVERKWPRKIVSGVQPTGILHLGNYFGAIRPWLDIQNREGNASYFIADLHSMTMPYNVDELRENIFQMTATLLACGIDPDKSTLFLQSTIPQHTELSWILGCQTTMPRLAQLPQYKEKSAKLKDVPTGLYTYPILQVADVLIYKATHVPCGDDQRQQLQLAQHLAKVFNTKFGETFPIIETIIADDASSRIKSLRDPTKKQSKSDPNEKSRVTLRDTPDQMRLKIKRAITDFTSEVSYEPESRPGVANLIMIHALTTDSTPEEICERVRGIDTGQYKLLLADEIIEHFDPIRVKIEDYLCNRDYLVAILKKGQAVASEQAEKTLQEVKQRVGINIL